MKLVIDRNQWLRGNMHHSWLKSTKTGKMCCLGFYCLSKGFSEDEILGKLTPLTVNDSIYKLPELVINGNLVTKICVDLMCVNDSIKYSEPERELELTKLFKEIDVEVEFIN